jgi:hypothetical protein
MCLLIGVFFYYIFLFLILCYCCVAFVILQFKNDRKGHFIARPVSSVVKPGEAVAVSLTMASTDQQLLIEQYQPSGGNVGMDFVANKIHILACAFLPEVEELAREESMEEILAGILEYIRVHPNTDRVFSKILLVEYVFNF